MDQDTSVVVELRLEDLVPHPRNEVFRQMTPKELEELAASIAERGFIHPLVVRPKGGGKYEVLSGHQRLRAAQQLGLETVPCVVAELDDTRAELVLLDANLNARHLGPMELARAIRRKKELLGERRGRPEKDGGNRRVFSGQTREMLAEQTGLSPRQLSEYDALNDLLPELQELVETGALGVSAGAGLARLPQDVQRAVWEALGDAVGQLKVEDVRKLREDRDRAGIIVDALTRRVQELEHKLDEVGGDEGLQKEIERLRQQKAALERDIANRVAWRKHLGRHPAARLIELVTEAVRPVARSMPEIEGLLGQVQLDRATAANLKPHIEVLRRAVGMLDKAVAEALPPVLVSGQTNGIKRKETV